MIQLPKPEPERRTDNNFIARTFRFELAPSTMITLAAGFAAFWLMIKLLPVLLVLVAAFFMVGTLNPAVHWMEEKKIGRTLSIGIVFGSLLITTVGVGFLTIPALLTQASSILEQEPVFRGQFADWLSRFPLSEALGKWLRNFKYGGPVNTVGATAFAYSVQALGFVAYTLTAIFLALYIMIDRDRLRGGLFAIVPRAHHIVLSRVMMKLETIVGAYIRGQVITSASSGIFMLILLLSCGVENAMALAVFAAVLDILPYVGAIFPVFAAVLSALPHGPVTTSVVLIMMLLYTEFEARVVVPKVYGQALRLPSTVVLFALLAGGALMGIVGALLALPFAAALMMIVEELRVQLPGEQEQVADVALREGDDKAEEEYERRTEGVSAEQSAAIAVEITGDRVKEDKEILRKEGL